MLESKQNRQDIEIIEETKTFPSFSQFMTFLTKEAKIACNPLKSLYALKFYEAGNANVSRSTDSRAKVLTVQSRSLTLQSVHSVRNQGMIFTNVVSVQRRVSQSELSLFKLTSYRLTPDHRLKNCENRSVCEKCQKKHPSCLHEDRTKAAKNFQQLEKFKDKLKERKSELEQNKEAMSKATSNRALLDMNNIQTSQIVPVWISITREPNYEVLVSGL